MAGEALYEPGPDALAAPGGIEIDVKMCREPRRQVGDAGIEADIRKAWRDGRIIEASDQVSGNCPGFGPRDESVLAVVPQIAPEPLLPERAALGGVGEDLPPTRYEEDALDGGERLLGCIITERFDPHHAP